MSGNPFPGLRAFEQKETHLFFGRDGQSKELLKRLQESRFLALVGVSGSGKSSLVRAGLLPALYGGLMSSVESDWRIAVFRPGNSPIRNMARALITEAGLGGESGFQDVEVAIAETTLRRGNLGLLELLKQAKSKVRADGRPFLAENDNVLLVVDQFEEIFRLIEQHDEMVRVKHLSEGNSSDVAAAAEAESIDRHPREEASAFVKLLLDSTEKTKDNTYPENLYIIVTMRSDYLGETAQFLGMPERINDGQYLIPRMNRDDRRKAIVGPVAVEGGKIAEPLVNQLLNDAGENPGQLPILQHALMRMWDLAGPSSRSNGGLNLDHYDQIGKLSGALSQHANEAFAELSPQHQQLAAKVFKCLTEKGLSNREIRRPMKIADICAIVDAKEKDVKTVVECFRKEGRWFLMPPPAKDKETGKFKDDLRPETLIDISHESLISGWDKLSKWVNEEAESARTYKRLADTAILKERGAEDFYRGPALQLALKWREENAPNAAWARRYHPEFSKAISFLDDSRADTQRREKEEKDRVAKELRRRRTYNIILGILVLVIAGLGFVNYAVQQQRVIGERLLRDEALKQRAKALEASKDAKIAEDHARIAEKKAVDAAANLQISLDKEQGLLKVANRAKAAAIAERDKARRLQAENAEQAIEYKFFKTASDKLAEGDRKEAVSKLREALHHFEKKNLVTDTDKQENKSNIISTHINIGDVFRNSDEEGKSAVKEYGRAIELMDKEDAQLRALTLMKAGHVWAKSKSVDQGLEAAGNYEEAATTYAGLGQRDEAIEAWIAAGTVLAKFPGPENTAQARADFDNAVSVSGNDKDLIAKTNALIGDSYVRLLEELAKTEDEDSSTRDSAAARATSEDKLREAGAEYFRKSAQVYESLKQPSWAASMSFKAGQMLSESNSGRLIESAGKAFQSAIDFSQQAGQMETEKTFLYSAGKILVRSKSPVGWTLANQFFESYITISSKTEAGKAGALRNVAQSYAALKGEEFKRTAAEYYVKASKVYKDLKDLDRQLYALLEAGNVLRQLNFPPTPLIEALDLEAFAVYAGDVKRQAETLRRIGDEYASSDSAEGQKRAIEYYRQSAQFAREAGDKEQEAEAFLNLGKVLITTGAEEEGKRSFDDAVKLYEGDVLRQIITLSRIGSVYVHLEPAPFAALARDYFQQAIVRAQKQPDKRLEVYAILEKAKGVKELDGEADAWAEVEPLYWQAIDVFSNDPANQILVALDIGRLVVAPRRDREQLKLAKPYFDKALAIARNQPNKKAVPEVYLKIGSVYELRDREAAIQNYETALQLSETQGDRYGQAMALYRLAVVGSKKQESIDRSLTLFNEVLPNVEASGNQTELGDAFFAMGTLYRLKKEYQQSLDSYQRALAIFEKLRDDVRAHNLRSLIETVRNQIDKAR
jgi:tetratricopeptide (TPR) repeat protein